MREYIIAGIGVLGTIVSASVAHLLTKRKYSADVDKVILENIDNAFSLYKKVTEETNKKVDEMLDNYTAIKEENIALKQEMDVLNKKIDELIEISCTIKDCNKRKKAKTEAKDK